MKSNRTEDLAGLSVNARECRAAVRKENEGRGLGGILPQQIYLVEDQGSDDNIMEPRKN